MVSNMSDLPLRLTRRSLLISSASAAALLAVPGLRLSSAFAQTPATGADGSSAFFDPSVVHDITATFDQDNYDAMIKAFQDTGDKNWLKATVTIDGVTFDEVGLRLKGNSSLSGLGQNGFGPPANFQPNEVANGTSAVATPSAAGTPTANGGPTLDVRVDMDGNVSVDEPEGLPWLVRLDKYVDDQNLNGLTEFVIRSNNSETALNEALALDLLAEAGLASQAAAYVRFTANDSEPRLRLAIENPDDVWLEEHFSDPGTLFKSESDGNWSYKDDDLDAYMQSFDLEAGGGKDDAENYAPLISFLDFINNSDDATFVSELPNRLDIDQFAVYLAMMDLVQNDDDIDGPGNNSYLFYDEMTNLFTVVPWDMNLAFGGMGGGFGGRRGGPGGQMPPNGQFPDGGDMPNGTFVINGTPVSGQFPAFPTADGTPVAGMIGGPGGQPGGGPTLQGGMGGMNNPLATRWAKVDAFTTLQSDTKAQLSANLFEGGTASDILARWVAVLETHAADLIDPSTIDQESQSLQEQIDAV